MKFKSSILLYPEYQCLQSLSTALQIKKNLVIETNRRAQESIGSNSLSSCDYPFSCKS